MARDLVRSQILAGSGSLAIANLSHFPVAGKDRGRFDRKKLYEAGATAMAATGLFQALMVKNRLRGSDYDRLLDLLNEKTIRLLGIYNRDQAARILCRIVLAQPRLLPPPT